MSKLVVVIMVISSLLMSKGLDYLVISKENPTQTEVFDEAQKFCSMITLYGLSQWQLPNTKELKSIYKKDAKHFWADDNSDSETAFNVLCVHPKPTPQNCYQLTKSELNETLKKSSNLIIESGELLYDTKEQHTIFLSFARKNIPHTTYNIDLFCEHNKESKKNGYMCVGDEDSGEVKLYFKDNILYANIDKVRMSYDANDKIINYVSSNKDSFIKSKSVECPKSKTTWKDVIYEKSFEDDMMNASIVGDVDIILDALDSGANIDATDNLGFTALSKGIEHLKVVKMLLNYDASIKLKTDTYESILDLAIERATPQTLQLLIDSGVKPTLKNIFSGIDDNGDFEIEDLFALGDEQIVKLLLLNGADVNIKDEKGYTPIYKSIVGKNIILLKLFVNFHAQVDKKSIDLACSNWKEGCSFIKSLK